MLDKNSKFNNTKCSKFIATAITTTLLIAPIVGCGGKRVIVREQAPTQIIVNVYDNQAIHKVLNNLILAEIDSYNAYQEIGRKVKNKQFNMFCDEMRHHHEKHIKKLSSAVIDLNFAPPAFPTEFKGFATPGFTLIQGAKNVHRALQALHTNEIILAKMYNKILEVQMPGDIREIVLGAFEDEKHLLNEVEMKLNNLTVK